MSLQFLEEHARQFPVGTPMRQKLDDALKEVDVLRNQLEELKRKSSTSLKTKEKTIQST